MVKGKLLWSNTILDYIQKRSVYNYFPSSLSPASVSTKKKRNQKMNPFDNLQSVSYRLGLVSATLRSKGLENKDSPILTSFCVLQLPFSYQHCFLPMENDFPNPEWIGPQRYELYKIWSMTISILFPVLGSNHSLMWHSKRVTGSGLKEKTERNH